LRESAMELKLPKGVGYIAAAVFVGLVATFGIHKYITVKTRVPTVATAPVAVAAKDVAPGTSLTADMVKMATWPKELIPPQSASSLSQVQGRVAVMSVAKGEPILNRKLAPVGTAAGLSGILDQNKRALTVRVDDVSGVGGFIFPGNRVDVLADIKMENEHYSKTILQNILVLTVGQISEQKGDTKPVVVNTVTMELSPEQAEILNLASNEGKIRLTLRNFRNVAIVQTEGIATSQLITGVKKAEAAAPASPGSRKEERTVEVIKGLERTKATL
jgi:pilus assembly protein CpaB